MEYDSKKFSDGAASCLDVGAINKLIDILVKLKGDPAEGKKGGFFSVYDTSAEVMVTKSFGEYPDQKRGQYFRNSTEKTTRLVKETYGNWRSFATRDESKEHWGGGICYGHLYCAFSGFPEKLDEALSLIYAMYVCHSSYWDYQEFKKAVMKEQSIRYKDNEFIELVLEAFSPFYQATKVMEKV